MGITDWASITSCVISAVVFGLSYWAWAQTRNSMSLYLGNDGAGLYLDLKNNSPHAVTVTVW